MQIKAQIFILFLLFLYIQPAWAAIGSATGFFSIIYDGGPGLFDTSYTSYSYSRVGSTEDSDVDFGHYDGMWLASTETQVDVPEGMARADSITPAYLATHGTGHVSIELNQTTDARSWTAIFNTWQQEATYTNNFYFDTDSMLDLPSGMIGQITYYAAVWEGTIEAGNLILTEKEGWTLSTLNFQTGELTVLKGSVDDSADPSPYEVWSTDLMAGREYSFFAYVEVNVIPEPATLGLMITGSLVVFR